MPAISKNNFQETHNKKLSFFKEYNLIHSRSRPAGVSQTKMAYASVISLKHTIQGLQRSCNLSIPISESVRNTIEEIESLKIVLEILDESWKHYGWKTIKEWDLVESQMLKHFPSAYPIVQFGLKDIVSLQNFLWSTRVDALDVGRVREAVSKLEEVLHQCLLLSSKLLPVELDMELDRVKQGIFIFTQTVHMINEEVKEDNQNKSRDIARLCDIFPKTMDLIREIKDYADKVLMDLKTTVRRFDKSRRSNSSRERVNALEVQIREAVCEFEDLLETRMSDQFLNSQSESLIRILPFPLNLHEVERYILPFTQLVRKLKQEYMNELMDPLLQENQNDDDIVVSSESLSCKNKCKIVGLHDQLVRIKDRLTNRSYSSKLKICTLYGMAGIGKTMAASKVFEDPSVLDCFELRVWIDVGQNYQFKRIMQSIIAQLNPSDNIDELLTPGDESLEGYLHERLNGRKYLIVLDDVWDDSVCDDVMRFFPDNSNGSRVLLTSRLKKVARYEIMDQPLRFLSNEESWDLLCEKVFGTEPCPSFLKHSGKKIAESCDGLPLTIVTVGELLSKVKKEPKKWNKLASNPNPLLNEAYEQMLKVLLPSYNALPNHELKACFLYMGVFPRNYEISRSEITKLWAVDIILDRGTPIDTIINELFHNSILMPGQRSSLFGIKNWRLHSSFWHLCKKEARKNKLFHAIECSSSNSLIEGLKSQRRLCIHNNVLLGIKDVHNLIASISNARAIHCTGPPHEYPVPICFGLKLLKILNALTIRLYEFPEEVLKLTHLKYLALTCYPDLSSPISKLRNLQFLIVHRHLSIISSEARTCLPIQIWDMQELKHLQVMGSALPNPCHDDQSLPNLETLFDVSANSCTKSVFKGIPNLKKLGIRIELAPHAAEAAPSCCFDHISLLRKLESLKCVVVNPSFSSEVDIAPPPPPLLNFPSSLEKLSLSGFGYPWEDMRPVASLPNLKTLKLRCYAFRGPKWEIQDNGFPKLKFLLVEDTDLSNWIVGRRSIPDLVKIYLKSCYKLEMIPPANLSCVIELDNCNPLGVACAKQLIISSPKNFLNVRSKSMLD